MLTKTTDQASIDMLKRLGKTDEEIAALNAVSMQGHGAETASGYAQIGGSREYRDATRKAKAAEKRGDWDEYEKQAQIAEDSEINRMNYAQGLEAKYGEARDTMTEKVNQTFYSLQHPQAQAELLDKKYKELMPFGWYNKYDNNQFDNLKNEITKLVGKDAAAPALKEIDRFKSVKNERALIDKTQQGGNVMPVALRYKNPMVHDFEGKSYREQTYSDLVDQALAGGHDALILKNTFDPGGGPAKLVDVGVVFSPDQIRSRFAAFDPLRKTAAIAATAGVAAPDLLAAEDDKVGVNKMRKLKTNNK
jgi:predicted translin family RNA/ssDNA-binding protein